MEPGEKQVSEKTERGLQELMVFWQTVPPAFLALYMQNELPVLSPCEFLDLKAIANGSGRSFGQIPQFLPFGRSVSEDGHFGFYAVSGNAPESWPVCYWDEGERFLRPVASDFDAFLRYCALVGLYESEGLQPEETRDEAARTEGNYLSLFDRFASSFPRNDTELRERLVTLDPQDAVSLCHLGCKSRGYGEDERALDFFHRASEAAPYFGDAHYLIADVHRDRGNMARAVQSWWDVLQRLLPFCTRTWEWDLGSDYPEADIYEIAADALAQNTKAAEAEIKTSPLWRLAVYEDPYDPDAREKAGGNLLARNDLDGAEREYLNALYLCCMERGKQPERLYDALLSLYQRQGRSWDAALALADRSRPRIVD